MNGLLKPTGNVGQHLNHNRCIKTGQLIDRTELNKSALIAVKNRILKKYRYISSY